MTSIESFIHRKVVVLREDSPASQAARAMCDNKVGCVLVADGKGSLAGIATDRDLACGLLASRSDVDTQLVEIMTTEPVWVDESASLEDVVQLMERNGIRRIPVVHRVSEGKLRCVGLVSLDDLIASRAIDPERLARIVQAQIVRKGRGGPGKVFAMARSEAHREQTLGRFHHAIREASRVDQQAVEPLTRELLTMLVRRLHYTGAAHFIAQLPQLLQEELLDLPAGPDRAINLDAMVGAVQKRLKVNESTAREVLAGFARALVTLVDAGEVDNMVSQLPHDIQLIFSNGSQTFRKMLKSGS